MGALKVTSLRLLTSGLRHTLKNLHSNSKAWRLDTITDLMTLCRPLPGFKDLGTGIQVDCNRPSADSDTTPHPPRSVSFENDKTIQFTDKNGEDILERRTAETKALALLVIPK